MCQLDSPRCTRNTFLAVLALDAGGILLAIGFPRYARDKTLVVRSPIPQRRRRFFFSTIERTLLPPRLFLGDEDTFFRASDATMRMQAFQHELCRADQDFRAWLLGETERRKLVRQPLNIFDAFQDFA